LLKEFAICLPTVSVEPPGVNPITILIGLLGNSLVWANEGAIAEHAMPKAAAAGMSAWIVC
jgi:hypothetical protein